ncbi:lipopolysaccharide kinase InaA family protein [Gammaproteobacteria bacterium]|nr:lipopolysaccharide kinase InaA family protein [Gammaproteobacteria bacterium]
MGSLLNLEEGVLVESANGSEVWRVSVFDSGGVERVLYLKKYFVHNFKRLRSEFLKGAFFGRSKAKREFDNLERLRGFDIDVTSPVAFGEERSLGRLTRCFLMTEEVPESRNLDEVLMKELPAMPAKLAKSARQALIVRLAEATRKMHRNGFVHRGFFFRNILISGNRFNRIFVFDAPRGRKWPGWLLGRKPEKDLATIDSAATVFFRQTERLRFYLKYYEIERLTPKHKLNIARILERAEPLRARQIRRLGV